MAANDFLTNKVTIIFPIDWVARAVMCRKEDVDRFNIFKAQNTSLSFSGYTQTALCCIFPPASLFLLPISESFQAQLDKFCIWKSAIGFFFLICVDLSLIVGSECLSFFLPCDLCFLTKNSFVLMSIFRFLLFQFPIESDMRQMGPTSPKQILSTFPSHRSKPSISPIPNPCLNSIYWNAVGLPWDVLLSCCLFF